MLQVCQSTEHPVRMAAIQCLGMLLHFDNYSGYLFRAHPIMMQNLRSMKIMDDIFSDTRAEQESVELRGRVLCVIQEFLLSQLLKGEEEDESMVLNLTIVSRPAKVNIMELIGETEGFADSGYV